MPSVKLNPVLYDLLSNPSQTSPWEIAYTLIHFTTNPPYDDASFQLMKSMVEQPSRTVGEMILASGCDYRTVHRRLKILLAKKLIQKRGGGCYNITRYRLTREGLIAYRKLYRFAVLRLVIPRDINI
jgi:predicted transcriptional regulator